MAAGTKDLSTLTADDELARRLCALAVAFSNAHAPLSSGTVHETFYAELQEESFHRKYARDRERLAESGLQVRQVGTDDKGALWQADPASFADGGIVAPEDALVLDVLCASLVGDPSFAYRHDLRLALAKIDHAFGTLTAVRLEPTSRAADAPVRTLISCMVNDQLARVTYVNARGVRSERTYAPYGSFGLRDHTYFVCAIMDGADGPDIRTLRSDRIVRVKPLAKRFEVPADFSVEDYILLPFQIGPTIGTAQLAATPHTEDDALSELHRRCLAESADADGVFCVPMSDEEIASAWSVAVGVVPLAPPTLVDSYRAVLEGALETPYDASIAGAAERRVNEGVARRGRPGASEQTRELLALVGSLSGEGATLTVEGVSSRLGVTAERARQLLTLLLTACSGSAYQLPLGLRDEDELVLMRTSGVVGRPIRLTRTETHALMAALETLGFDEDDPLRSDVLSAFAAEPLEEREASEYVSSRLLVDKNEVVEACSRARVSGAGLTFLYQGLGQHESRRRRTVPMDVRRDRGAWYLDAMDLDRKALRSFRVDRMSDVRVMAVPSQEERDGASAVEGRRIVTVSFGKGLLAEALDWPEIEVFGTRNGHVIATIPYFGGDWLPRHLAACGGQVSLDDEELAMAVRSMASARLADLA